MLGIQCIQGCILLDFPVYDLDIFGDVWCVVFIVYLSLSFVFGVV